MATGDGPGFIHEGISPPLQHRLCHRSTRLLFPKRSLHFYRTPHLAAKMMLARSQTARLSRSASRATPVSRTRVTKAMAYKVTLKTPSGERDAADANGRLGEAQGGSNSSKPSGPSDRKQRNEGWPEPPSASAAASRPSYGPKRIRVDRKRPNAALHGRSWGLQRPWSPSAIACVRCALQQALTTTSSIRSLLLLKNKQAPRPSSAPRTPTSSTPLRRPASTCPTRAARVSRDLLAAVLLLACCCCCCLCCVLLSRPCPIAQQSPLAPDLGPEASMHCRSIARIGVAVSGGAGGCCCSCWT